MKRFDIHDRIFRFVIEVLKLIKYIPQTVENKIIINQLVRSVTSVGANDQEADGVSSRKDFMHCYTIVRKELKETRYWLSILSELDNKLKSKFSNSIKENDELIKIISSIISKVATKIS
ncbi:MAG: four helix bundle protein [Patescibacteria group bacterium]